MILGAFALLFFGINGIAETILVAVGVGYLGWTGITHYTRR